MEELDLSDIKIYANQSINETLWYKNQYNIWKVGKTKNWPIHQIFKNDLIKICLFNSFASLGENLFIFQKIIAHT